MVYDLSHANQVPTQWEIGQHEECVHYISKIVKQSSRYDEEDFWSEDISNYLECISAFRSAVTLDLVYPV